MIGPSLKGLHIHLLGWGWSVEEELLKNVLFGSYPSQIEDWICVKEL